MSLEAIFEAQLNLQVAMKNPMGVGEPELKENVLAMQVELCEVLNETNWKLWKKEKKPINREKLIEELVDVLQFYANICNSMGITPADLEESYSHKLGENYRRIESGY